MPRPALLLLISAAFLIAAAVFAIAADQDGAGDAQAARRIVERITVAAPREAVWEAWTTTAGVQTFFSPAARVELRHGGPYEVYFDLTGEPGQRGSEGCEVLAWVPREMLAFTWNAPPQFPKVRGQRSFVVVQFADAPGGGTEVTLTHDGFGDDEQWDATLAYFRNAWPHVLRSLRKRFDDGPLFEPANVSTPQMKHYVYFIRPAREDLLETGPTEAEAEALRGHMAHIEALLASDVLVFAGPALDPPQVPTGEDAVALDIAAPGVVVFRAPDDDAARRVMAYDPAVAAGVFRAQVNRFNLAYQRP